MFLSDYPRPPADTGWGLHGSAGNQPGPADAAACARYLRQELGITWFKVVAAGTSEVDLAAVLAQQGIEVILRLYAREPHPYYAVSLPEVQAYIQAGVHYVEWGNEPNLVCEWNRPVWDQGCRVDRVCEQFLRNADVIRRAGGIPLLPALSPGGDYPHRDWYRATFEWLRRRDRLSDLTGAALAIHNRPFNNPLTWMDRTGCFFLEYEWIDDLVRSYVGRSLPLLGTEAGYEPGSSQNPAFPPIDALRHAEYNLELLRGFGPYGSRRWRDALFCQCVWLVDPRGEHDLAAARHEGRQGGDGASVPAIEALRREWQARPFRRRLDWQETPAPDYPRAAWRGSPNVDARPAGVLPALIVLYATGGDFNATLQRLQDPASRASYHYLISRSGSVYQLVPEDSRAWHAGDACWQGRPGVDDFTLAIGLLNRNDGVDSYATDQLEQAAMLVRHLTTRYRIRLQDVVTGDMIGASPALRGFDLRALQARVAGSERLWPPDDVVRQAAWQAVNIPYDADGALPRAARDHKLGNPETPEFDFEFEGRLYRGQGFGEGIAFAEVGCWGAVQVKPW